MIPCNELQLLLKLSLLIRWHIPSSTPQLQVSKSYRNTQHLDWSNNNNFYYQNDQDQPLYLIDWSCPIKDTVNASLDVTLVKVVCSKQIYEGVLCPQEPDIIEHGFITVYTQCHYLHSRPCNHWILQAVFTYKLYKKKKKRVIQVVFGFTGKLDIVSKEPQWWSHLLHFN